MFKFEYAAADQMIAMCVARESFIETDTPMTTSFRKNKETQMF
jgi:hypothetical protein